MYLGGAPLGSGTFQSPEVDGPFSGGVNINTFLGANRFYSAGYTGTRARVSVMEGFLAWGGHETLTHVVPVLDTGPNPASNLPDEHPTSVAFFAGGRPTAPGNEYERGIAYGATLFSQAIGVNSPGAFIDTGPFSQSEVRQVRRAFSTGLTAASVSRPADVVNTSFGALGDAGQDFDDKLFDGFISANPRTLHVTAAGNDGTAPVDSPGAAYNSIAVGATGEPYDSASLNYNQVAIFSSFGPNGFWIPTTSTGLLGTVVANARATVDLVAPGSYLAGATYNPTTGTASTYNRAAAGTSFAAPTVAGGAALLQDAAYDRFAANPDARDGRVIKAVLMNSAEKTVGWNNGQSTVTAAPVNGGAAQTFVRTRQSLDYAAGAGRMDLGRAFDQYLSGTTDVPGTGSGNLGPVLSIGWDYGVVNQGTPNTYTFANTIGAGATVRLTLAWFRDRSVTIAANDTIPTNGFAELGEDNLDLQFWALDASGQPVQLVAESSSVYNNEEHLFFTVSSAGQYAVRVLWTANLFSFAGNPDVASEQYGLAWNVTPIPEPVSALPAAFVGCAGLLRRRRGPRSV
jgi:hypothetical protein